MKENLKKNNYCDEPYKWKKSEEEKKKRKRKNKKKYLVLFCPLPLTHRLLNLGRKHRPFPSSRDVFFICTTPYGRGG